ncbi:hypothetical protein LCGC14_1472330 [marine sediment metagenome]|uniref:Uncharacterized protein n=1 Tax=marine sediment metagenome TaxID=412755 RepID=A0A0F9MDS5_9ZZZZ
MLFLLRAVALIGAIAIVYLVPWPYIVGFVAWVVVFGVLASAFLWCGRSDRKHDKWLAAQWMDEHEENVG